MRLCGEAKPRRCYLPASIRRYRRRRTESYRSRSSARFRRPGCWPGQELDTGAGEGVIEIMTASTRSSDEASDAQEFRSQVFMGRLRMNIL